MERVVVLVDMDCFYCQVESRINPDLKGKPMAVVQYNAWKGGGIIAVNYEARDRGVTRHMRGDEAKKHCPEIELVTVPTVRDKADLTKYRDAGREVLEVLCTFSDCVQRASVDEAYIDLTNAVEARMNDRILPDQLTATFVVGYSSLNSNDEEERKEGVSTWLDEIYNGGLCDSGSRKLAIACVIVEEMRAAVYNKTGFRCSAGIAHNKILSKLACGLHKPNRQTVLPHSSVQELYQSLPLKKVRNLGGKFGNDVVENLGCKMMSDLLRFTERELQAKYDDKTGTWLYNIARGIDLEPVTPRLISKSIGCCKRFPGRTALGTRKEVMHWLTKLCEELSERLLEDQTMNKRRAQLITISIQVEVNRKTVVSSKSTSLSSYEVDKILNLAFPHIARLSNSDINGNEWGKPLTFIGLSAGKFTNNSPNAISQFFKTSIGESEESSHYFSNKKESKNDVLATEEEDSTNNDSGSFFKKFFNKNKKASSENQTGQTNLDCDDSNPSKDGFEQNQVLETDQNSSSNCTTTKNEVISKANSIANFFKKNEGDPKQSETVSIKKSINDDNKASKPKGIQQLFNQASKKWINPCEIFPDLDSVDEETISFLPPAFQKKILELKGTSNNKEGAKDSSSSNNDNCNNALNLSNSNKEGNCSNNNFLNSSDKNKCFPYQNDRNVNSNNENIEKSIFEATEKVDSVNNNVDSGCKSPNPDFDDIFGVTDEMETKVNVETKKCPKCDSLIELLLFEEHMDLHLAEELDRQWNRQAVTIENSISVPKKIFDSKGKASKRKLKGGDKKVIGDSNKKFRSIDSFFAK